MQEPFSDDQALLFLTRPRMVHVFCEHLSPVDESACNPKPKSVRQTGRYPFNAEHNDLANDSGVECRASAGTASPPPHRALHPPAYSLMRSSTSVCQDAPAPALVARYRAIGGAVLRLRHNDLRRPECARARSSKPACQGAPCPDRCVESPTL